MTQRAKVPPEMLDEYNARAAAARMHGLSEAVTSRLLQEWLTTQAAKKHYGPGRHPGTGTSQDVHAGDGAGGAHSAFDHVNDEWKRAGGIFDQLAAKLGIKREENIALYVEKILAWQKSDPEEYELARNWYRDANRFARQLAEKHGLTVEQVAGVIAATSPGTDWDVQNKSAAETFIQAFKDDPYCYIRRMDVMKAIAVAENRGLDTTDLKRMLADGKDAVRVRLSEVPDDLIAEASIWFGDDAVPVKKSTYWRDGFEKAGKILRGQDVWQTLNGPKLRAFTLNISDPENPDGVTVDSWAIRAATRDARVNLGKGGDDDGVGDEEAKFKKYGSTYTFRFADGQTFRGDGEDVQKLYMFGQPVSATGIGRVQSKTADNPKRGGGKKLDNPHGMYAYYADMYEEIARRLKVLPNEAQALVWVYVRDVEQEVLNNWPANALAKAKAKAARTKRRRTTIKSWRKPSGWLERRLAAIKGISLGAIWRE